MIFKNKNQNIGFKKYWIFYLNQVVDLY